MAFFPFESSCSCSNLHRGIQRETKTIKVSVDAQEKTFLTLTNSYSLIVHYSFYSGLP